MPMQTRTLSDGGVGYGNPFLGPVDHTEQITVDLSDLTYADASGGEVDAKGYLIPGTPLKSDGTLLDGTVGEAVYGVVVEAVNVGVAVVAADTDLDALTDIQVAVARIGVVQRDIVEDNLGRVLSANEIAGFAAAGSLLTLTQT